MTRSRKKTPCCHVVKPDPWYKPIFNRKLRRNPIDFDEGVSTIPDGMAYRRANESWLIYDWKDVGTTFEQFHDDGEDDRNWYERCYIRK